MKKISVLILFVLISLPLVAQKETIEYPTLIRTSELYQFIDDNPVYENVFKDPDNPDKNEATKAAWNAFAKAYKIEGLPHGLVSTIFQPNALSKIDVAMENIGNSLALMQIAHDLYIGDTKSASNTAIKTSMYYAISKWGWSSLQIASVGMQILDYMLTTIGEATVEARKQGLWDAYFDYYEHGLGKMSLEKWQEKLGSLQTQEEVEKYIHDHLEAFFYADALDKKLTRGWHTEAEIKSVKAEYLQTYLLPYLNPMFQKLNDTAYDKELEYVKEIYIETANKLNQYNHYKFQIEAPYKYYNKCQCGIQVMSNGNKKIFVKGDVSDLGACHLKFTKYSVLANNITQARAVLRVNTPDGTKMFYKPLDLSKDLQYINFTISEEDLENEETQEDVSEKETKQQSESPVELKSEIRAIFTANGVPVQLKIKKTSETPTLYRGTVKHKQFPKGNTVTINKVTRELTFIYKLKGPFAPELICKGLPVAPNAYTGIIVTNDGNAVPVGPFSMVLLK